MPETPCNFSIEAAPRRNENIPATGTALGIDDEGDNFIRSAASDTGINMWLWVNQVCMWLVLNELLNCR